MGIAALNPSYATGKSCFARNPRRIEARDRNPQDRIRDRGVVAGIGTEFGAKAD